MTYISYIPHHIYMRYGTGIILHNIVLKNYRPRNYTEVNVHEILKVSINAPALEMSYCNKEFSLIVQTQALFHCSS